MPFAPVPAPTEVQPRHPKRPVVSTLPHSLLRSSLDLPSQKWGQRNHCKVTWYGNHMEWDCRVQTQLPRDLGQVPQKKCPCACLRHFQNLSSICYPPVLSPSDTDSKVPPSARVKGPCGAAVLAGVPQFPFYFCPACGAADPDRPLLVVLTCDSRYLAAACLPEKSLLREEPEGSLPL